MGGIAGGIDDCGNYWDCGRGHIAQVSEMSLTAQEHKICVSELSKPAQEQKSEQMVRERRVALARWHC